MITHRDAEAPAWETHLRSGWLIAAIAGAVVVLSVGAATAVPGLWIVVALTFVVLLVFVDLHVIIDRRGLRVYSGLLRFPIKRIALADIASVDTEHISPMAWAGWGYRVVPGGSALVLRSGPGLVIRQVDGSLFAVTLPDPQTPADLLDRLRQDA